MTELELFFEGLTPVFARFDPSFRTSVARYSSGGPSSEVSVDPTQTDLTGAFGADAA